MRVTRSWFGFGLLVLSSLSACGSDDPKPVEQPDASLSDASFGPDVQGSVDSGGTPVDAAGIDGGLDSGGPDAGPCIPLGCEELGFECGQATDNCGGPLNCDLANNVSPCEAPNRCGGDVDKGPNKCGCKMRPDACAAQGANCGKINECGQEIDCGTCADGKLCLTNRCECTPNPNPCGTRVCGSAPDGCGATVNCGASNGQCPVGVCDANGQCACRPKAEACAGRTDSFVENGCSYDCGNTCTPDNAAACAGAECGTAVNNCGEMVACGAAAGACATGSTCIDPVHVSDSTLPARSGAYSGGYCVADGVAKLVGKYAVRAHAFRRGGADSISFINRAEAVSLVQITYTRATGRVTATDTSCVATTTGDPADFAGSLVSSRAPSYRKMPAVTGEIIVSGSQWSRPQYTDPVLGAGLASGYKPGMPDFCVGKEGQEVELPANDPRRDKWWSDNRCVCPTAADASGLPKRPGGGDPNNYSTTHLRDCRIIDDDQDGEPGFSVVASVPTFRPAAVYNAGIAHSISSGVIRDDRYHVGTGGEAKQPVERVVLGCSVAGGACAEPSVDCGCREDQQPVQFVPLPDSAALDCSMFLSNVGSANEDENQTAIDLLFGVAFGSCSGPGTCPPGSICRENGCMAMTSEGACASETCPSGGAACESCPSGMSCRSGACWPTDAECPVNMTIGGLCKP